MPAPAPHPGPPPAPFTYPFVEAATAVRATEELLGALDAVVESHVAAADHAQIGFEGATRRRFDSALEAALDDLGRVRRLLAADLGALEDDVAAARRRAAETEEAQRRWAAADRRWREGRRERGW